MSDTNKSTDKAFTLHEVASAGLTKAVKAKRSRLEDCTALPGLPAPKRRAAPACGGSAAIADVHGDAPTGPMTGDASDVEVAMAADAVADVNAANWIAEEEPFPDGDDHEFEWEDGDHEDANDGSRAGMFIEVGEDLDEPDDAEAKQRKRRAMAAQRKLQLVQHQVSTLCGLARGMAIDRAANCRAVQAAVLSIADPTLHQDIKNRLNDATLAQSVRWIKSTFQLCEPDDLKWGRQEDDALVDVQEMELTSGAEYCAPAAQRIAAQLIRCIHRREATEEQIAALLVAYLRGAGAWTRYVSALQVIPLWRVRSAAKSSQAANRPKQAQGAAAKLEGSARIVTASPKKSSSGARKFGRKAKKQAEAKEEAPATTNSNSEPAATATEAGQRQRRGDEEFERQLQMALLATKEDALVSASTASPAAGEQLGGSGPATIHIPSDSTATAAAQRSASLYWAEVFCGAASDGAWVHADAYAGVVGAPASVEACGRIAPALSYVAAFVDESVKDVTRRYAASFVKTLRARDEKWFTAVMQPLRSKVRQGDRPGVAALRRRAWPLLQAAIHRLLCNCAALGK
eukprot:jgi/Ulvmu1/5062/UM021_0079.1